MFKVVMKSEENIVLTVYDIIYGCNGPSFLVFDPLAENWSTMEAKHFKPYEQSYKQSDNTNNYDGSGTLINHNFNYDCCKNCLANPKNGGSGQCNCALPQLTTVKYI